MISNNLETLREIAEVSPQSNSEHRLAMYGAVYHHTDKLKMIVDWNGIGFWAPHWTMQTMTALCFHIPWERAANFLDSFLMCTFLPTLSM